MELDTSWQTASLTPPPWTDLPGLEAKNDFFPKVGHGNLQESFCNNNFYSILYPFDTFDGHWWSMLEVNDLFSVSCAPIQVLLDRLELEWQREHAGRLVVGHYATDR